MTSGPANPYLEKSLEDYSCGYDNLRSFEPQIPGPFNDNASLAGSYTIGTLPCIH